MESLQSFLSLDIHEDIPKQSNLEKKRKNVCTKKTVRHSDFFFFNVRSFLIPPVSLKNGTKDFNATCISKGRETKKGKRREPDDKDDGRWNSLSHP